MAPQQAITSTTRTANTPYAIENGWIDRNELLSFGDRRPLQKAFIILNIVAGLSAINNIAAQLIAISFPDNQLMHVVLRCYMIVLFAVVVLNEAELTSTIRESKILYDFITRGIFYTFLGILGVVEYDVGIDNYYRYRSRSSSYNNNNYSNNPWMPSAEDCIEWYLFLVSWIMFGIGVIYFILGVMCMQRKLESTRNDYQQHQQQQPKGAMHYQQHPLQPQQLAVAERVVIDYNR